MKLIIAIVQDKDGSSLASRLAKENVHSTKLASTAGFLKEGNIAFLIVIEEERLDKVLTYIKESSSTREQFVPNIPSLNRPGVFPVSIIVGGATVFVLDIFQFEKF